MFDVTMVCYGEIDFDSYQYVKVVFSISEHTIFYETANGIRHVLGCDFSSIFDDIHKLVKSIEFQKEVPTDDGCDGDWYTFKYNFNGEVKEYKGYIYGLENHTKLIDLIMSCAKEHLDDEIVLLEKKDLEKINKIVSKRNDLANDFLDWWVDL